MKIDSDDCVVYESGDPVMLVVDGVKYSGEVTDPRDGYELEVVYGRNRATTVHVTELEPVWSRA